MSFAPAKLRLVLLAGLAIVAVGAFLALQQSGFLVHVSDPDALRRSVLSLGLWGPAMLIGLMAVAIIAPPVPSSPIGLAAVATYGPVLGALLTIVASGLGSFVAFGIARFVAYDAVREWSLVKRPLDWLEEKPSQKWLMAAVFLSRLLPFISFDAVGYAAGLTPLAFWRFALATIAGVTPISFVLAYSGDALLMYVGENAMLWTLLAGGLVIAPIILKLVYDHVKRAKSRGDPR